MFSLRLSVVLIATLLFAITQARLYDNNNYQGGRSSLNRNYEGRLDSLNNYEGGSLLNNNYGDRRGGVSSTTRRETQTTRHVVQDNDRLGRNYRNGMDSLRDTNTGYDYNNNLGVNTRRGVVGSGYARV
uniref:Uncharacterized protein n=1 Tax=Magallana gigas TaxID=29159 RepID=K1QTH0_MAGGI